MTGDAGRGRGAGAVAAAGQTARTTSSEVDFRPGVPDLASFPRRDWAWALREACRNATPGELGSGVGVVAAARGLGSSAAAGPLLGLWGLGSLLGGIAPTVSSVYAMVRTGVGL